MFYFIFFSFNDVYIFLFFFLLNFFLGLSVIRPDETFLLNLKAIGFDPKCTGKIFLYFTQYLLNLMLACIILIPLSMYDVMGKRNIYFQCNSQTKFVSWFSHWLSNTVFSTCMPWGDIRCGIANFEDILLNYLKVIFDWMLFCNENQ